MAECKRNETKRLEIIFKHQAPKSVITLKYIYFFSAAVITVNTTSTRTNWAVPTKAVRSTASATETCATTARRDTEDLTDRSLSVTDQSCTNTRVISIES